MSKEYFYHDKVQKDNSRWVDLDTAVDIALHDMSEGNSEDSVRRALKAKIKYTSIDFEILPYKL